MAGRPYCKVDSELLETYISQGLPKTEIATLLGVSRPTLNRLLNQHHGRSCVPYSSMTDDEVDTIMADAKQHLPFMGERMVIGFFRSKGLKVQRRRIRSSIKRIDPEGVIERRSLVSKRIRRRIYSSPFPHFIWHIDGNHKLIRWKFIIHAAIDGFSRFIVYIRCSSDNKADTVLQLFTNSVTKQGLCPCKIRTDVGVENRLLWRAMPDNTITGSSVHNQRIERLNRDINVNIRNRYGAIFYTLERDGMLDVDSDLDIAILHCVYLPKINRSLDTFAQTHNHHPIRTENNLAPDQLIIRFIHLYHNSTHALPLPPSALTIRQNTNNPSVGERSVDSTNLIANVAEILSRGEFDFTVDDGDEGVNQYRLAKEFVLGQVDPQ